MKKTVRGILCVILCACLVFSGVSFAFAEPTENKEKTVTAAEQPDDDAIRESLGQLGAAIDMGLDAFGINADLFKGFDFDHFWNSFVVIVKKLFVRFINLLSNIVINDVIASTLAAGFNGSLATADYEEFDLDSFEGFLPGNKEFLTEPAEGARWQLGYGSASVMPEDFGEKQYAKGAYLPNIYGSTMYKDDDGADEELRVRVVAISDGSGRGTTIIASVDAMGLCNADARKIREAVMALDSAKDVISVNVSCTHIHTGIDSQGVWNNPVGNILNNNNLDNGTVTTGVDPTFLKALTQGTAKAADQALKDLRSGTLKLSVMDISDYVHDRTAPIALDTNLYKLEFVPDEALATPTILATFGCHPESSSYDWNAKDENGKTVYDTSFTADFVWYMEKIMNMMGYNFIYVQGDVGTVTSSRGLTNDGDLDENAHGSAVRYGYELGYIILTMSMTEEERIEVNEKTGDRLGIKEHGEEERYSIWYEGLSTVESHEVAPLFNIASSQFTIQINNYAMAALGKTSATDNFVLISDDGHYYTVTEVGYMEIGTGEHSLKVYVSPGETFGELLIGGNGLNGFAFPSLREMYGDNVIVMDLMNDAAGYVYNDKNFVMVGLQYNEESGGLDSDTWGIISYGDHTGSTLIGEFIKLVESKTNTAA